jgi:hypothetical protein
VLTKIKIARALGDNFQILCPTFKFCVATTPDWNIKNL